jgi:hypothetical protein
MKNAEHEVVKMERAALDVWCQGNPDGFLAISAPDVVYFDPFHNHRIDGHAALKAMYDGCKGKFSIASYKLIDPKVQLCGDSAAVLTFNYEGVVGDKTEKWNCTEVYRKDKEGWRIVQTHWSQNNA